MARLSRRTFVRTSAWALVGVLAAGCARETITPSPLPSTLEPTATPEPSVTLIPTLEASVNTPAPQPAESATATATTSTSAATYLSLHPFVEAHPEAVFIKRTSVSDKTDSEAKQREGLALAGSLFAPGDTPGIPLGAQLAIKANLTCASGQGNTDAGMGILTDKFFLEGMIEGLVSAGFPAEQAYIREGNWLGDGYCSTEASTTGYPEMAQRTGVHLTDFATGKRANQLYINSMEEGSEVIWKDVPEGVVFKRIPYVAPFNAPDSWLLDVAKLKTHGMGLTLSAKNLQGMVVPPYTRFCEGVEATLEHPTSMLDNFQPDLESHVEELYEAHKAEGYPRWDRPGRTYDGGYGMEMWSQRTCDSLSVSPIGLAMVEGIYGRNGNAFLKGPGPGGSAEDFMMNVVIFGKNPFLVDIVGVWLAGHEPGNMGLFHIARERGLSPLLNPMDIPLYLWGEEPTLVQLDTFERTPLLTNYMRRDYDGQNEAEWHMLDEPYDYGTATSRAPQMPGLQVLGSRKPGQVNASTVVEYRMPAAGDVLLEVLDAHGARVDVLAQGRAACGVHAATWRHGSISAGTYTLCLHLDGHTEIAQLSLA